MKFGLIFIIFLDTFSFATMFMGQATLETADRYYCTQGSTLYAFTERVDKCGTDESDNPKAKLIWKTRLPYHEKTITQIPDPTPRSVEGFCSQIKLEVEGDVIISENCHGNRYFIGKQKGKLIKIEYENSVLAE